MLAFPILAFCLLLLVGFFLLYEWPESDRPSKVTSSTVPRVQLKKVSRLYSKNPAIPVNKFIYTKYYKKHGKR